MTLADAWGCMYNAAGARCWPENACPCLCQTSHGRLNLERSTPASRKSSAFINIELFIVILCLFYVLTSHSFANIDVKDGVGRHTTSDLSWLGRSRPYVLCDRV